MAAVVENPFSSYLLAFCDLPSPSSEFVMWYLLPQYFSVSEFLFLRKHILNDSSLIKNWMSSFFRFQIIDVMLAICWLIIAGASVPRILQSWYCHRHLSQLPQWVQAHPSRSWFLLICWVLPIIPAWWSVHSHPYRTAWMPSKARPSHRGVLRLDCIMGEITCQ